VVYERALQILKRSGTPDDVRLVVVGPRLTGVAHDPCHLG
jgi:hypothetical protein